MSKFRPKAAQSNATQRSQKDLMDGLFTAMKESSSILGIAQERAERFQAEIKGADEAMAAQLLAAWKEVIMGELVKTLQATKDLHTIAFLDINIAVGQETEKFEQSRRKG